MIKTVMFFNSILFILCVFFLKQMILLIIVFVVRAWRDWKCLSLEYLLSDLIKLILILWVVKYNDRGAAITSI